MLKKQVNKRKYGASMILMQYAKWSPQEFRLANIASPAMV